MSQYRICCYDDSGKMVWSGPERDIPSLPAGRCVLQDGEVYRLRGGKILAVTGKRDVGVWIDIASANSSERVVLMDKVARIHNYSTLFTIQDSNGGRIAFDPKGKKLGWFQAIIAKKEEATIFGINENGDKIVIVKDERIVLSEQ